MMSEPNAQVGIHGAPTQKRAEILDEAAPAKKLTIEVTPAAIAQIVKLTKKRLAEGKPVEGLRIGLRGGGCDGFSYVFEWADKPAGPRDHVIELSTGDAEIPAVRVLIDKKSMLYLAGTTLNFVSGLMGHGFKFENPNVKGSCGCGESVQF
jgi:iron-sulfur cluster assembly protein